MPMFVEGQDPLAQDRAGGFTTPTAPAEPTYKAKPFAGDVYGAGVRLGSPVFSVIEALKDGQDYGPEDPNHNPLETIGRGSKYDQFYRDEFLGSRNEAQTRAIMQRIDKHEADRKLVEDGGGVGTAAMLFGGLLDPTLFLPIGGAVKTAEGGYSVARSALQMGLLSGLQAGVSQQALNASQPGPHAADNVIAIASGTLLGGLLGGALGALTRKEQMALAKALDADRAEISRSVGLPAPARAATATAEDAAGAIGRAFSDFSGSPAAALDPMGSKAVREALAALPDDVKASVITRSATTGDELAEMLGSAPAKLPARFNGDAGFQVLARSDAPEKPVLVAVGEGYEAAIPTLEKAYPNVRFTGAADLERAAREELAASRVAKVEARLNEAADTASRTSGIARSVGAAASDPRELRPMPLLPRAIINAVPPSARQKAADWLLRFSPTQRVFFKFDSLTARRAVADLIPVAFEFEDNLRGIPTAHGGAPAWSQVELVRRRMQMESAKTFRDLFAEYRYGENVPGAPIFRSMLEDARGGGGDKLSWDDFKREITKAQWAGYQHEIPQVQRAAEWMRDNVFRPTEKRLYEAGLTNEERLKPRGDDGYATRVWNAKAVAAKRDQFVNIVGDWLAGEQTVKAAQREAMETAWNERKALLRQLDKIEGRLETAQKRAERVGQRLDERGMEVTRSQKRADTVAERADLVREEISQLEEFIGAMKGELKDPDARAHLADLEREVRDLRQQDRPLTQADLDRIEREEVAGTFGQGDYRLAAEVAIGRRKAPSEGSFLRWVARSGGIFNDPGGDVKATLKDYRIPGLIRNERSTAGGKMGGLSLDDWGETLAEMAGPGTERFSPDQVLRFFEDAARGKNPWFWDAQQDVGKTRFSKAGQYTAASVNETARHIEELVSHLGEDMPTTLKDLARLINGQSGRTLEDVERANRGAFDALMKRLTTEEELAGAKAAFDDIQSLIDRARGRRSTLTLQERGAEARASEAGMAASANRGRLGLLQDQLDRTAMVQDILASAQKNAKDAIAAATKRMEDELRAWKGKSAVDALDALKKRDEAERVRALKVEAGVMEGPGQRLRGADKAVDRAVKRILRSDRDLSMDELRGRADEIANRLIEHPDGRLPYDVAAGAPKVGKPPTGAEEPRGLMAREFAIPTRLVEDFVETDPEHLLNVYTRTLLPDLALHERFGDVNMEDVFRKIADEYSAKSEAAKTEKAKLAVDAERQAVERDVAAIRDRVRGVYGWSSDPKMRQMAEISRVARSYNTITDLGTASLNSMADAAGAIFRWGLGSVFGDAYLPYLSSLMSGGGFHGAANRQAKAMSIAIETDLNLRGHQMADVLETYRSGSKFARGMQWAADKSQLLNGQSYWTDKMKTMAATVAVSEHLRMAERVATGKATEKDIRILAASSIDRPTAERIWQAYSAPGGGEKIDGVYLANTAAWPAEIRDKFEAAMLREGDIAVVTPGHEKPLWLSDPVFSLLGQFKSFTAATHEKVLLAGMQRRDGNTLAGLASAVGLGMLSYKLYSVVSGRKTDDSPAQWVKEGLSRGGVLGWMDEANNSVLAKFSGGKIDMYRLIGAEKPLSRMQQRDLGSALLGPTYGKLQGVMQATGAAFRGDFSAADTSRLRRLLPLQNLWWVRNALNQAEEGVNTALGVPPRPPQP